METKVKDLSLLGQDESFVPTATDGVDSHKIKAVYSTVLGRLENE